MSKHREFDVLQHLHATDACNPPPPGEAITSERLRQRLQRRRRTARLASAAVVFAMLSAWSLLTGPTSANSMSSIDAEFDADLNAIGNRIDDLLADLAEPVPVANLGSKQLRYELALARASALVSLRVSTSTPSAETHYTTSPDTNKEIR